VYIILKKTYPDKDWADKVKSCMEDFESYENNASLLLRKTTIHRRNESGEFEEHNLLEEVAKYLDVMNIEYETKKVVDGIEVPIYIKSQKTVIGLLPSDCFNFDRFTFNGKSVLTLRVFKNLLEEDEKFVYVSLYEFMKALDNMSRLNYLIAQGIENENTTGTFDFSKCHGENENAIDSEELSQNKETDSTTDEDISSSDLENDELVLGGDSEPVEIADDISNEAEPEK